MYNPQLRHWLRRDRGADAGAVGRERPHRDPGIRQRYAALIPGARFALIEEAGHHPELEQPRAFVEAVARFLGQSA